MEMLNNIWNALSTENMGLVNLMIIPFGFVESILGLHLFMNLLNFKFTKKQAILYVMLSASLSIVFARLIPSPFNLVFNYVALFIITFLIFKESILKTIVAILLHSLFFALINLLLLNVYINALNITHLQAQSIPIYRFIYFIIIYMCFALIVYILKHINFKIKILEDFDKKTKVILILNFLLGLITIAFNSDLVVFYTEVAPLYISFLSFIILIAYFSLNLYSLNKVTKLTITTRELETAEEYNRSITVLYDDVKGFKHDFNNIVSSIGGYIDTNDMEGLKEYYYPLREDCQRTNNIAMLNPNIINNPAIYSLLSSKYHKADGLGIKINFEFFVDLNEFEINPYEFSRILGILLDNAIEAASECKNKIINICFRNEFNKNRHIVLISNTYKDKNVDTEKIFEKGKSGKENHSGLGLWEVRQYIKKHNNLNLYTFKNDKYFSQQFEIYYNKK